MEKCSYCGGSILEFQVTAHEGCAKLAGIGEVVEWMRNNHGYLVGNLESSITIENKIWQAKLKEWGIEKVAYIDPPGTIVDESRKPEVIK